VPWVAVFHLQIIYLPAHPLVEVIKSECLKQNKFEHKSMQNLPSDGTKK